MEGFFSPLSSGIMRIWVGRFGLVLLEVIAATITVGENLLPLLFCTCLLYTSFFPRNGVRYIAMNDGIDTLRDNNDIAPFKNILNLSLIHIRCV